jgi:hypothetical protein
MEKLGEPRDVPKYLGTSPTTWMVLGCRDTCVETGVRFGVFCALASLARRCFDAIKKYLCQAKKGSQIHYGALILLIRKLDMNIDFDAELVLGDFCRADRTRRHVHHNQRRLRRTM